METELSHYAILGQKHGVRRFQYPDGRWTEAGKIRYGSRAEKREARKRAKEDERTQKEVAAAAERRKKILENPAELRKHLDEFSEQEVADAIKKFDTSRKLADISKADLQRAETYFNSIANILGSSVRGYNSVAAIMNTFIKDANKKLPGMKAPNSDAKKGQ